MSRRVAAPKMGPEPVLISRKEVEALYEVLDAVRDALATLNVEYIVTGGSLLGAVRQHSILFCDDDIDIALLEQHGTSTYEHVASNLAKLLGPNFAYKIRPWEGGDRVVLKRMTSVFLDLFTIRKYTNMKELMQVIGVKKNGNPQPKEYTNNILSVIQTSIDTNTTDAMFPFYQFTTRKAIELWPKECYREHELYPLNKTLRFGNLEHIQGPRAPVTLLKRAFGSDCFEVYYQSASHKQRKQKQKQNQEQKEQVTKTANATAELKPLLLAGGLWEGGTKQPLEDKHYIPIQPIARAQRLPTTHNRASLVKYLQTQESYEKTLLRSQSQQQTLVEPVRPRRTIYMDGVFDLFHVGHLEAIEQCAQLGDRVIIGVTGDLDAANYKRPPIVAEDARTAIVQALQHVDRVVCPCPLVVSKAFMEKEGIDLVVHGFANDKDAANQENFFAYPVSVGKFQRIKYSSKTSTTEIIEKIYRGQHFVATTAAPSASSTPSTSSAAPHKRVHKPQWFGASVALVTNNASALPSLPYPLELQQVVSSHVKKATIRRTQALNAIREATGPQVYDKTLHSFQQHLIKEGDFSFDTTEYPLRNALLRTCQWPTETNLEQLHTDPMAKDTLLRALTGACTSSSPSEFQHLFDSLVRNVCAPKIAALYNASVDDEKDQLKTIYYQAFPCIRIVQPGEFSIGPHADVSYGHHPCSINFYIPLTTIQGTSALHLESAPGAEDWHPIEGRYGTTAKHFAGAVCLHWTTENKTSLTRVSLDCRMIPGPMFTALKCGGHLDGGQLDVYRRTEGYYSTSIHVQLPTFEESSTERKDDGKNTSESTAAPISREANFMNVRSKAQEIRPRLYLTNFFFARNKSNLRSLGITHVLVCGFELPCRFPQRFTYHKINLADNPKSDVLTPMRDALLFMKQAIESGGTLLVHCAAGGSRSVVFVMAFLLFVDGVVSTVTEALNIVKSSRPGIDPNFGFLEQLEEAVKSGEDYNCGKISRENRNNNLDGGKDGAENVMKWKRTGPLINPGIRTGYPFTVKNWDKVFRQKKEGRSTGRR